MYVARADYVIMRLEVLEVLSVNMNIGHQCPLLMPPIVEPRPPAVCGPPVFITLTRHIPVRPSVHRQQRLAETQRHLSESRNAHFNKADENLGAIVSPWVCGSEEGSGWMFLGSTHL